MSHDLALVEETPNHLIALALDKGANPDTLSKLMDLQDRWQRDKAQRAFVVAMTGFKIEAPAVLKKNDVVDFSTAKGRTSYKYANLGSIVQEITAVMGKHELSASWSTEQQGNQVTVTCHITHVAGHRESVTLTGPIDESGNKNAIQAVGSTVTYLQRYTLLAALGLATGEDDDGRQGADHSTPIKSMDRAVASSKPYPCPKCQEAGRDGIMIAPPEGTKRKWACSLSKRRKIGDEWQEVGICKFTTWDTGDFMPAAKPQSSEPVNDEPPPADAGGDAIRQYMTKLKLSPPVLNKISIEECGGKKGLGWGEQSPEVQGTLLNVLKEMAGETKE